MVINPLRDAGVREIQVAAATQSLIQESNCVREDFYACRVWLVACISFIFLLMTCKTRQMHRINCMLVYN